MKPNFKPSAGDEVRVRHPELGVVDAIYLFEESSRLYFQKIHYVLQNGKPCIVQPSKPYYGKHDETARVRFVYPVECMPDYKGKS